MSFYESIERWSLLAWWSGQIGHELLVRHGPGAVRLIAPFPGVVVVVLSGTADTGGHVYGFAAAGSEADAIGKARVELGRNAAVLDLRENRKKLTEVAEPQTLSEQRLLYFASEIGYRKFLDRTARLVAGSLPVPRLLVDRRVAGPWDLYCRVWRCLLEPPVPDDRGLDVFLF